MTTTRVRSAVVALLALVFQGGLLGCGSKGDDQVAGKWTATGSLKTARAAFTTTTLASGKVLVAGGQVDSVADFAATATAEVYDPTTRTWTPVASMGTARRWACAALLPSGKVLVVGGDNLADGPLQTAEVYDPVGDTWSPTAGPSAVKRLAATCTRLGTGEVLVAGGQDEHLSGSGVAEAAAERYDPITGLFTPTGSMATGRSFHTATALSSGEVLVVGGCTAVPCLSSPTTSAERYDPATGTWSSAGALPYDHGVAGHTATLLQSGQVLVAGGDHRGDISVDDIHLRHLSLYDPGTGTWTDKGFLASGRLLGAALRLSTGDVVIAGGDLVAPAAARGSTERYLVATGTTRGDDRMVAFHGDRVGTARLDDGSWLVVGGMAVDNGITFLHSNVAEIYKE